MKKLIILLLFFCGCVAFENIDMPLTLSEQLFYERLARIEYPKIDSIERIFTKSLYGDRTTYCSIKLISNYNSKSIDTIAFYNKAHKTASFVLKELKISGLNITDCTIKYGRNVNNAYLWYFYKLNENGEVVLKE